MWELRRIQDDLADHAESIADSVDPQTLASHEAVLEEMRRGGWENNDEF